MKRRPSQEPDAGQKPLRPIPAKKIGPLEPSEIQTLDVDRLWNKLLKRLAPQTVKHVLSILKRTINFGVKKGLCDYPDPRKLQIETPRVDNTKTECLSPEQIKAFLQALDEEPDQNGAAFMRKGALLGLQWDDIDFKTGFKPLCVPWS